MSAKRDKLSEALAAIESNQFDPLTPNQVARLEAALNDDSSLVERLGSVRAHAVGDWDRAIARATPAAPSAIEWESVWTNIQSAGAGRSWLEKAPVRRGAFLHIARAAMAVAACAGIAFVMRQSTPTPNVGIPWAIQLSSKTEVQEIEAPDALVSFDYVDDDSGALVLWFTEDEGASS